MPHPRRATTELESAWSAWPVINSQTWLRSPATAGAFPLQATARFHFSEPHPELSWVLRPVYFPFFYRNPSSKTGPTQVKHTTKIYTRHHQGTSIVGCTTFALDIRERDIRDRAENGRRLAGCLFFGACFLGPADAATHQWLSEADGKRAHDQSPPWHRSAKNIAIWVGRSCFAERSPRGLNADPPGSITALFGAARLSLLAK